MLGLHQEIIDVTKKYGGSYMKVVFSLSSLIFTLSLALTACTTNQKQNYDLTGNLQTEEKNQSETFQLDENSRFNYLSQKIHFRYASADLTPSSKQALNEMAIELKTTTRAFDKIRIFGFTDSSGHLHRNHRLSQLRADKTRKYLISKGVPAQKLEAIGLGPISDDKDVSPDQRALNRRVAFEIVD